MKNYMNRSVVYFLALSLLLSPMISSAEHFKSAGTTDVYFSPNGGAAERCKGIRFFGAGRWKGCFLPFFRDHGRGVQVPAGRRFGRIPGC